MNAVEKPLQTPVSTTVRGASRRISA